MENYLSDLKLKYPGIYQGDEHPLLTAYRNHALTMILTPKAYGDAIDRCFSETIKRWNQCGGKFAKTAREMKRNARELKIQVMPSAFFVTGSTGGNIWAAGMADTDGRTIFAMTSAIQGNSTGAPYINTFENLVCWEIGNNFAYNMGYYPQTLVQEIGFQSPCKLLKK